jgi:transposase
VDYGNLSKFKKKARTDGSRIVFEDEAGFRQDPTLHRTWSRVGQQPLIPQLKKREGTKVLGCVDIEDCEFKFNFEEVLESRSYMAFLETTVSQFFESNRPIHYIQDNASYHKDGDVWLWFKKNRKWIEVYNLPSYCPELNAAERLWKYTRVTSTHNKYFNTVDLLKENLCETFDRFNKNPENIRKQVTSFL